MVYADFNNSAEVWPPRLSSESIDTFLTKNAGWCKKILIPFAGELRKQGVLGSAIAAASLTSAELILLLVRPPAVVKKYVPDHESLFTALKALQAQLQGCRVRVRFESITGSIAASIVEYAYNNNVDLIVMGDKQVDAAANEDVAQAVRSRASCPTLIVQEN